MRQRKKGSPSSNGDGDEVGDDAAANSADSFGPLPFRSQQTALIVAGVGVACYFAMLGNGFTHDDKKAIINNADLRPTTGFGTLFVHDYWGTPMDSEYSHKSYRPLAVILTKINFHM